MNAPEVKTRKSAEPAARVRAEGEEDLAGGWFVQRASETRPVEKPKSVPPTGDDEVDSWLR